MESVVERATSGARAFLSSWRSSPPPAGSWSSLVWAIAIGLVFFFLSNPLALEPDFAVSFGRAAWAVVCAALLTLPWFRLPRLPWTVGLLLLLMAGSGVWSIAPWLTWAIFLLYLKVALMALACAAFAAPRTIAFGMTLGGVIVFATSIYAYVMENPAALAPPGGDGYLAGVGTNRNILAYTLILSFAAAVAVMPRRWWARAVWGVGLAMICVGLFLSQSGSGFVAASLLTVTAGVLSGVRRWRRALSKRGRRYLSLSLVGMLVLTVIGWPLLGLLLGRDSATLSGRTEIWAATWRAVAGDRLLGQGWGTVWGHPWAPAPPNPVFNAIYADTLIPYTHGHNSLFDVLPEVGLVGVLLVISAHIAVLYRGWTRIKSSATSSAVEDDWLSARVGIIGVLALALFGVTEPMVTTPLGWFVLVTLSGIGTATYARHTATHSGRAGTTPTAHASSGGGRRAARRVASSRGTRRLGSHRAPRRTTTGS